MTEHVLHWFVVNEENPDLVEAVEPGAVGIDIPDEVLACVPDDDPYVYLLVSEDYPGPATRVLGLLEALEIPASSEDIRLVRETLEDSG